MTYYYLSMFRFFWQTHLLRTCVQIQLCQDQPMSFKLTCSWRCSKSHRRGLLRHSFTDKMAVLISAMHMKGLPCLLCRFRISSPWDLQRRMRTENSTQPHLTTDNHRTDVCEAKQAQFLNKNHGIGTQKTKTISCLLM